MKTKYNKRNFKIGNSGGNSEQYYIQSTVDNKYMHDDHSLYSSCGINGLFDTAKEAGECLDKYFEKVEVTREQIAEKFGCREDQLKIVD
jgi:hypothetical protein